MRFEWDPGKNASNLRKHRVGFEVAQRIWYDPDRLEVDATGDEYGELRWKSVGRPDLSRLLLLLVISTEDEDGTIRIISARKAEPNDVRDYDTRYQAR